MMDEIINDEQAKLIADFANKQTVRLINFCKKNKDKFGDNPKAVMMTAYAVNIVAILKSIEHNIDHKLTPEDFRNMMIALLDRSIQFSRGK